MSLLMEINKNRWYNFPYSEIQADLKPYSLKIALRQKIKVPEFIITNNMDQIKKFASNNNLVIKAISNADLPIQDNLITKTPDFKTFKSTDYTITLISIKHNLRNRIIHQFSCKNLSKRLKKFEFSQLKIKSFLFQLKLMIIL